MEEGQWGWMMKYCLDRRLAPARRKYWEQARQAWADREKDQSKLEKPNP